MVVCPECGGRKTIDCPVCKGLGAVYHDEESVTCPRCQGKGFVACPCCVGFELESAEKQIIKDISKKIEGIKEFMDQDQTNVRLRVFFEQMCLGRELNTQLKSVQKECERKSINRHDRLHALTVCRNALRLFQHFCLEPDVAEPYFMAESVKDLLSGEVKDGRSLFDTKLLAIPLAAILAAAYCHDMGRDKKYHEIFGSMFWNLYAKSLDTFIENKSHEAKFRNVATNCIANHSGETEVNTLEESILIIADNLDCEWRRVQPGQNVVSVLQRDPGPEHYFSHKDILKVEITSSKNERSVKLYFEIKGHAAIEQMVDFREKLGKTIFRKTGNRGAITVRVRNRFWKWEPFEWERPELELWPEVRWV